ncbi:MAG: hypothetical protein Q9217_002618 [Psora testacea]
MTAPYRSKPPVNDNDFEVNEDPLRLDQVYEKVLGKRIVELQTTLALVHGSSRRPIHIPADAYDREPFKHPALQGLDSLTDHNKAISTDRERIAQLGERYGLDSVLRWKPRKATNLQASGLPIVLQQALYAIIGAVALQKGGQVANDVVRDRILSPLGLHSGA